MSAYRFYHPVEVRYGDLDPQGHLNNARYFTYMEQARVRYLAALGLWNLEAFLDLGIILAEAACTYLSPIRLRDSLRVGVRSTHLGTKSIAMEYLFEEAPSAKEMARGRTVVVAFDYGAGVSIPIPPAWREAIAHFEGPSCQVE